MTTALPPQQNTEPSEQRVVLRNVGWDTYESLLRDLEDSSAPRLTYDRGTLEIMSPLRQHEELNRTINLFVEVVTEEWEIDTRNLGSTTFRREDLERGFEPDTCFYIQNAAQIEGTGEIDLLRDPAPDLVIEIDITHPSLDKMALFARLGVPEVWRYDGSEVTFFHLENARYEESETSRALPRVARTVANDFVRRSVTQRKTIWVRELRRWAREQLG